MSDDPGVPMTYERPHGPSLYDVCDRCNYNRHQCSMCGDELTHAQQNNGTHLCYLQWELDELLAVMSGPLYGVQDLDWLKVNLPGWNVAHPSLPRAMTLIKQMQQQREERNAQASKVSPAISF